MKALISAEHGTRCFHVAVYMKLLTFSIIKLL